MVRRLSWIVALGAAVAMTSSVARATPPDTFGFGSRSVSLAGSVAADVEDWSANYYNPAGLVRSGNLRIGLNYAASRQAHEINGVQSDLEPVRGTSLGLVVPAEFGSVRFAFGVGLYFNDQRLTRTRSALLDHPRWELYDTRPHRVWITANLAIRPWPWLHLGVGVTFQSPSDLQLALRGQDDVLPPGAGTRLEHQFIGSLTSIRYPQAGVQIVPNDQWSLGLTYRGSYELRNRISAVVDAELVGLGDPIPAFFDYQSESVSTYGPQQVSFGLAYRPTRRLRLGAEVTWVDWSAYQSPVATEEIVLEIEVPPEFEDMINVPDEIEGRRAEPLFWQDRWVPRIGVEYRAVESTWGNLDLRLGYFFEQSPVPEQTGNTSFADTNRHAIAVGMGIELTDLRPTLPGSLRIDAHFQYAHLTERTYEKESLVDAVGDVRLNGRQFAGGIGLEVAFE